MRLMNDDLIIYYLLLHLLSRRSTFQTTGTKEIQQETQILEQEESM